MTSSSDLGGYPPPLAKKKMPGFATASLILGILCFLGASILIIPTILAIVFGHIAHSRINKDPQNLEGGGLALTGLILGYVSIVTGIMTFGLLAAMAIPAFQKVRENSL